MKIIAIEEHSLPHILLTRQKLLLTHLSLVKSE